MGLADRTFLLDQDDTLYRLASGRFMQILRDPTSCRFPRFAGQRVRMANILVELFDRQPIEVVWSTFGILTFDSEGYLDTEVLDRQQRARIELALALAEPRGDTQVVDASRRFVAQGGRWTPSAALARSIDEAALGRRSCRRL